MNIKRMYLTLLVAAVIGGCALRLLDAGVAGFNSASGLGETIGRVAALFLVASLVSTVLVLLYRKRMASAAFPTVVGILVLVAFSYSSYRAIEFEHTLTASSLPVGWTFSPQGCEFAVVFPGEPKMTSVIVPELGEIPEAEISDPRGLMRANCINASDISNKTVPYYQDRDLLLRIVQNHADQNGLGNVSYIHESTGLGIRASARGTKQLEGRLVTYETIWFVSPRSAMSLTTGYFSESYPTQEISRFLDSVTRTDRSTS